MLHIYNLYLLVCVFQKLTRLKEMFTSEAMVRRHFDQQSTVVPDELNPLEFNKFCEVCVDYICVTQFEHMHAWFSLSRCYTLKYIFPP